MAQSATPNECLLLFSSAISAQPGSINQRLTLNKLKQLLDQNPAFLPILYPSLLSLISANSNHQLHFRLWISSIIQIAISKSTLPTDQKLQIVLQSTETIHRLITLQDPSDQQLLQTKKLCIQAFSSAYPILFKHACTKSTTTNDSKQWGLSNQIKGTILSLWRSENSSLGIRLTANKFVQRVIQVGTRGLLDPRKRNEDPSIVMCTSQTSAQQHPYLRPKELEQEATNLLEESIRIMFQSKIPELVAGIIICLGSLVRLRPNLSPIIMSSLASYNPSTSPLMTRTISVVQLKGIEKTLRITLSYLDRTMTSSSPYTQQIREALVNQAKRIEDLNEKERERKRLRKEDETSAKKRSRVEQRPGNQETTAAPPQALPGMISSNLLPGFDVTSLPVDLVAELVIANLQVLSDQALSNATSAYLASLSGERNTHSIELKVAGVTGTSRTPLSHSRTTTPPLDHVSPLGTGSPIRPKMEVDMPSKQDPESLIPDINEPFSSLNRTEEIREEDLAIDEEDLILQPNPELEEGETTESGDKFIFPETWHTDSPVELCELSRRLMIKMTLDRIVSNGLTSLGSKSQNGVWSTLLARLVTRGMASNGAVEEVELRKDSIRQSLFQFVIADFPNRIHFARAWLMEEWLAKPSELHELDHPNVVTNPTPYEQWLTTILDYIVDTIPASNQIHSDSTRPVLSGFLMDLPAVSTRELVRLQQMCQDPDKLSIGFTTLRDLTTMRPTLRNRTLDILLGLSTHSRRQTRTAAIMSVKSWVSANNNPTNRLGERVVSFAVQLLQKLEKNEEEDSEPEAGEVDAGEEHAPDGLKNDQNQDTEMEDGETTELEARESTPEPPISFAKVQNAVIISGLGKVKTEDVVVQHLELLLALSARNPDLLDHLFRSYPLMPLQVQESVHELITPLMRTLGGKHPKIMSLIQNCQSGSESLVLRILSILTEKGKPPAGLIEAIKSLVSKSNDLSPRFIVPTIGDLTKSEIIHHLPRVLTLLNGKVKEKNIVRSVFEAVIQQPPSNFGSVSTNAPRVKQSELLTPVELLVLIHRTEDAQYSIKQAIEAIGLCFSLTEIFKPEVLAAFMQQVVDELTLPTLFLRTVIQAVQTYKSLQAFVSTTLLSRLILKKIWTQPQLWEGFMRCAKIISPHSFGAILQLPRDQLKELVGKQAGLKGPLREYVIKKAGSNKNRVTSLLEILSDNTSVNNGVAVVVVEGTNNNPSNLTNPTTTTNTNAGETTQVNSSTTPLVDSTTTCSTEMTLQTNSLSVNHRHHHDIVDMNNDKNHLGIDEGPNNHLSSSSTTEANNDQLTDNLNLTTNHDNDNPNNNGNSNNGNNKDSTLLVSAAVG